jgi:hypothetical protein
MKQQHRFERACHRGGGCCARDMARKGHCKCKADALQIANLSRALRFAYDALENNNDYAAFLVLKNASRPKLRAWPT